MIQRRMGRKKAIKNLEQMSVEVTRSREVMMIVTTMIRVVARIHVRMKIMEMP